MKATDELRSGDYVSQMSLALTGDGPKERKILKAMAGRYPQPNTKILWIPEVVSVFGRGNSRTGRYAGFSVFEPAKTYIGKYRICSYLILVDYEYVNQGKDLHAQIEREIRKAGFCPVEIHQLSNQSFLLKCRDSAHEVSMRVVILGNKKCVEENEAALINLQYQTDIVPEKDVIANFYKRNNMSLANLIENASAKNLTIAFADLSAALDSIENSR